MPSLIDKVETIPNPQQPHLPVVLILDCSRSMKDAGKIVRLNEGLMSLVTVMRKDEFVRLRADLAIVTFGGEVKVARNFSSVEDLDVPHLEADGDTPMGQAILKAIELTRERRKAYRDAGVMESFKPWLFLLTDGEPTDMEVGDALWNEVQQRITSGMNRDFVLFAIGVAPADMKLLSRLVPFEKRVYQLEGLQFEKLFEWIADSMSTVSRSRPQERQVIESPEARGFAREIEIIV